MQSDDMRDISLDATLWYCRRLADYSYSHHGIGWFIFLTVGLAGLLLHLGLGNNAWLSKEIIFEFAASAVHSELI